MPTHEFRKTTTNFRNHNILKYAFSIVFGGLGYIQRLSFHYN